ncbi:MAG TPA: lipopolysaccharide heptosyltransferase II [Methylomirabilota bacterium]|nr:lipopolysaccharide heptosyltransferase II [Methylomirabilota bacterium]
MPTVEKILVRGVNWLGDAVMSTPALQRLREAKPDAHITLLTHEKLAELWQGHRSIDGAMPFGAKAGVFTTARRLKEERFDTAIVFPNSVRSALEVFFARIPARIGYARNARGIFLTRAVAPRGGALRMHKRSRAEIDRRIVRNEKRDTFPSAAHHVHDYLRLVSMLGANSSPLPPLLCVSQEEMTAARSRFGLASDSPFFAMNPGAEYGPAKRWPAERFVEAACQLHERTRCQWVILGSRADRELTEKIASELSSRIPLAKISDLAGKTSLRELCAVLKSCALLLTNDTGPMHVAAAVGTPVVVPFGSTSPELTGPSFVPGSGHQLIAGEAPCAPCFLRHCPIDFRCMKSISAGQVIEAALRASVPLVR